MALSKKGNALEEQAERAKAAAKLSALGRTLGNIMGVRDEEAEGTVLFVFSGPGAIVGLDI